MKEKINYEKTSRAIDRAHREENALLEKIQKALDKQESIRIWNAAKRHDVKALEDLEACPREDYIQSMLLRVAICVNCDKKLKCPTGRSNYKYFKDHLTNFSPLNNKLWKPANG